MCESIKFFQKYNLDIRSTKYATENLFSIPKHMLEVPSPFLIYFTRKWDATYTLAQIDKNILKYEGIDYEVIYHRCNRDSIRNASKYMNELKLQFPEKFEPVNILLSFRAADTELIKPTVLISFEYASQMHFFKNMQSHKIPQLVFNKFFV